MKIRAILDRLIVEAIVEPEPPKNRIKIPEHAKGTKIKGVVLSAGPGYWHPNGKFIATTVKAGDVVMFDKERILTNEFKEYDGKIKYCLSEQQILGIIEE